MKKNYYYFKNKLLPIYQEVYKQGDLRMRRMVKYALYGLNYIGEHHKDMLWKEIINYRGRI